MKVVVTGGTGFVMANFLRHWLEADAANTAISIDTTPLDDVARRYFEPVSKRVEFVTADICARETWSQLPDDGAHIVHGATVTPYPFTDPSGQRRNPEREDPLHVLNVNVMGTAEALNWARNRRNPGRFIHVSTGSVYADSVPEQEKQFFALPEDGYIGPIALYDISKYSSELIAQRFKQLYKMELAIVRLSTVFGPMDRQTPARNVRNIANHIAHAAAEGRVLKTTSTEAVGDYVYAPDVGEALRLMLIAPRGKLRHDVYNVACGITATVADLVADATAAVPEFSMDSAEAATADIVASAARRTGKWAAYDIARAKNDFGWRPRPPATAMRDYIAWLKSGNP
ncbi:MAG TPA: NAD(P)-dependent oxidoreductase [Dongiaceae bacterium]|jgi:UDP-glucose 4-epimerase